MTNRDPKGAESWHPPNFDYRLIRGGFFVGISHNLHEKKTDHEDKNFEITKNQEFRV